MSKVITFSRVFPSYHPKAGQPTYFVEKIHNGLNLAPISFNEIIAFNTDKERELLLNFWKDIVTFGGCKYHTIRAGNRWKVGDKFSPRVWSGKPYQTKQIIIAPDIEIKKIWDFEISGGEYCINGRVYGGEVESHHELLYKIAENDGLSKPDLLDWLKYPKQFSGQIICFNENINY